MKERPRDRLTLPIRWQVVAAWLAGLSLLLLGLGALDAMRSTRQLAALEFEFCGIEVPTELLRHLDEVLATADGDDDKALAHRLSALHRSGLETYYRKDGVLWNLSAGSGVQLVASNWIPVGLGPWDPIWSPPECRAAKSANYLSVGRQAHSPQGIPVLMVLHTWRSPDMFD
jgi:hypothetical protein